MTTNSVQAVETSHSIIGIQRSRQGAGQTVPEDLVCCLTCGWMRCSDYAPHLLDAARPAIEQEIAAQLYEVADDIADNVDWSDGRSGYGDNAGYEHSARVVTEFADSLGSGD